MIDEPLVTAMIAEQHPRWAGLPVRAVVPGGHDNRTFRLGEDLVVRLPSAEPYAAAVAKEQRWLPLLAEALPVAVPVPVAAGRPSERFPWPWSINRWLDGDTAEPDRIADSVAFAEALADVLLALHRADTAGAPSAGAHNFHRGGDLAVYDAQARRAIRVLGRDSAWAEALWQRARASRWAAEPVWVHGDVADGNLLVRNCRLSAVIDFGGCGVGDPASDLVIAWTSFDSPAAHAFARRLALDDATWERAAGWALWKALITVADPSAAALHAAARRTLDRLRERS